MYDHLKNLPPIMDHNRECIVNDSVAYYRSLKTVEEKRAFMKTLPTSIAYIIGRDNKDIADEVTVKDFHYYQAKTNFLLDGFDKKKQVEELFALLKRNGQGLTLFQEDVIRKHAFGIERVTIPLKCGYWGVEVWVSEKLPTVYEVKGTSSPLAKDTEMLDAPRVDHDITHTEEYKAMLAARGKR